MTQKARFHIEVPLDKLSLVETVLQGMDISFDPKESMFHLPAENLMWSVFTGKDGQFAVDRLNEHLQTLPGPTARVLQAFPYMTPEARRDLLELATQDIQWSTDEPPP